MANDLYCAMHKENKKKTNKSFELSQVKEDPMDIYLESIGKWKKRIARDGSCLFRAVAEQIYPCQMYYQRVRQECVEYMAKKKDEYEKHINIPFDQYLKSMQDSLEYGGQLEIYAMSKLYRRDFMIYNFVNQDPIQVTNNGFDKKIWLCYSYNNHFDTIFDKSFRDALAITQSIVYEILYDKVFGSEEQVEQARRVLRESKTIYPKEYMRALYDDSLFHDDNVIITDENDNEIYDDDTIAVIDSQNIEEDEINRDEDSRSLNIDRTQNSIVSENDENKIQDNDSKMIDKEGKRMPLPFRVAKSLDSIIYRNTELDAWSANKEDIINQRLNSININDLCLVKVYDGQFTKLQQALLQHKHSDNTVDVYILGLEKCERVPFSIVKPFDHIHNVHKHVNKYLNDAFRLLYSNGNANRKPKSKNLSQMPRSQSSHIPLATLHEENESDFMHNQSSMVQSQSVCDSLTTYDRNGPNQNILRNKLLNPNNKNRRNKHLPQSKSWDNQIFNKANVLNMGSFPTTATIDPSGAIYPPSHMLYGPTNSVSATQMMPQSFQNAHYNPSPYMLPSDYYYTNLIESKPLDSHYERKRHVSNDSFLSKQSNLPYQQVPQHPNNPVTTVAPTPSLPITNSNYTQTQTDINKCLLMPVTSVNNQNLQPSTQPTLTTSHTNSGMQNSYSWHGSISQAAYDANPTKNSGPYYYGYLPHPQNNPPIYTQATSTQVIMQPNQSLVLGSTGNVSSSTSGPSYANACVENSYDLQFPRIESNQNIAPPNNKVLIDDPLLNDAHGFQNANIIWSKDNHTKNENLFHGESMYTSSAPNNPPLCYQNYILINIDGPINYNASYSYSEADLPDMNTIRYFYNLGVEHFRLCMTSGLQYNVSSFPQNFFPNQPTSLINSHIPMGDSITTSNNNNSSKIANNNSNAMINHDIDKINASKLSTPMIDTNNNNVISNQLVPNLHNNKPFLNHQTRR